MPGFKMANNPLADPNKMGQQNNVVQSLPPGQDGPLTGIAESAALPLAEAAIGAAKPALAAANTAGGLATGAGLSAGLGSAGAALAAAAGPFALMALPFLLNYGTNKVPGYADGSSKVKPFGDDPLDAVNEFYAPSGSSFVESQPSGSMLPKFFNYIPNAFQVSNYLTSRFKKPIPQEGIEPLQGKVNRVQRGVIGESQLPIPQQPVMTTPPSLMSMPTVTTDNMIDVGNYEQQLADYRAAGFNYGTPSVKKNTNMSYANGVDSVPSMLTPGEAVIPAPAAQNPDNKPMINAMINEGRAANDMAEMAGPLSGPAQRAQMEALQTMAMKKKAFEAQELRKQQAFNQKLALDKQKALMSMQT